jgi:hypothetical protein
MSFLDIFASIVLLGARRPVLAIGPIDPDKDRPVLWASGWGRVAPL